MTTAAELVFFPIPGISHLIPMVQIGQRLIKQDNRITITILIVKNPSDKTLDSYIESFESASSPTFNRSIKFLPLPELQKPLDPEPRKHIPQLMEQYKPVIKKYLARPDDELTQLGQPVAAGLVIDMFFSGMIEAAKESNVPVYLLYTSAASTLSLLLHLQSLRDDQGIDVTELGSQAELEIPGFKDKLPGKVLPSMMQDKRKDGVTSLLLNNAKMYRRTKGIILNTFMEIEPRAIRLLSEDPSVPPVYPLGPIVDLNQREDGGSGRVASAKEGADSILRWLDDQPSSSVAFLCFGSMGRFDEEQIREIAKGLEQSGHRFLWSLRLPGDAVGLEDLLPDGFLDRTAKSGKIIGWAPQIAILSHPAVGGFVSHCGWNSVLESVWFGVPTATWPLSAEQPLNAFRIVKDLGLAVEIRLDNHFDLRNILSPSLVKAEKIGKAIKELMDTSDNSVRNNVKEMSEKCRKAAMEGGASDVWSSRFVKDVMGNLLK